jgi:VWFA-related protein
MAGIMKRSKWRVFAGFILILTCSFGLSSRSSIIRVEKIDQFKFSLSHPVIDVFLNVLDGERRFVNGLTKNDFELLLNRKKITHFSVGKAFSSKEWISAAVLVDISGSMRGKPFEDEKMALKEFVDHLGLYDQVCLMTFNEKPKILLGFTRNKQEFLDALATLRVKGNTALFDAVDSALTYSKKILSPRKAIIVLSDGLDTRSKISFDRLSQKLPHVRLPIFTIGLGNKINHDILKKIAGKTGGKFYFSPRSDDLLSIYKKIAENLKNAYVLKDIKIPSSAVASVLNLEIRIPKLNINITCDFLPAGAVFRDTPARKTTAGKIQAILKKINVLQMIKGKNIYLTIVLVLVILAVILFTWFYFPRRNIVLKILMTLNLVIIYLVLQLIVRFYIKI